MAFKPSDSAPNPVLLHYKDQLKLNKTFKIFTRNYQLAYVGLNTAKEQIKSSISESECVWERREMLMQDIDTFNLRITLSFSIQNTVKKVKNCH